MHTKKRINWAQWRFSSSLFFCQHKTNHLLENPSSWASLNSKDRPVSMTVVGSASFLWIKLEQQLGFRGKPHLLLLHLAHFLTGESEITKSATISTEQQTFECSPTLESCCADVCSSNIYQSHFSNTWEKNTEWNHNRGKHHLLWTAEFDLFWREQANKSVHWSVSKCTLSPALMLSCCFLCEAAVFICSTVLGQPFYTTCCIYLVWIRMQEEHTHRCNHS